MTDRLTRHFFNPEAPAAQGAPEQFGGKGADDAFHALVGAVFGGFAGGHLDEFEDMVAGFGILHRQRLVDKAEQPCAAAAILDAALAV